MLGRAAHVAVNSAPKVTFALLSIHGRQCLVRQWATCRLLFSRVTSTPVR